MGGGGSVAAPAPSDAEVQLQQQQANLLKQQTDMLTEQARQQQLLAPILYQQAGITPIMDADGQIKGFTQTPQPNQDLQNNVNTQVLQNESDALAGKLPVNQGLTDELNQEDQTLNSSLQKNLGPGYATSSPGIEALSKQALRRGELTQDVSTGNLTNAAAIAQGQAGQTSDLQAQSLNKILAAQGSGNNMISLYGQVGQGYSQALQPYQQQQSLSLNAAMANQSAASSANASKNSMIGAGVGIAASAAIII